MQCVELLGTGALLLAGPAADVSLLLIKILEGHRQADKIADYPSENGHCEEDNSKQGGTRHPVLLQRLGHSRQPPLPFGPIALFEFHSAPVEGVYHPHLGVETAARFRKRSDLEPNVKSS